MWETTAVSRRLVTVGQKRGDSSGNQLMLRIRRVAETKNDVCIEKICRHYW
jgi:hypothetical protein